ncbi:hypothetical protein GDO78_012916 [Eleutherodactylus coqui]|uniref:Uncharacterized protein n=1 Tax=Eleutherodactylus coqui TaxID=57060 RepID=A0A8J6EZ30_ELECQ|nr:hypothetical protein GDO78_012916 [Eleutherodactylus coqui]
MNCNTDECLLYGIMGNRNLSSTYITNQVQQYVLLHDDEHGRHCRITKTERSLPANRNLGRLSSETSAPTGCVQYHPCLQWC